jgi:hypothetical protein
MLDAFTAIETIDSVRTRTPMEHLWMGMSKS